MKWNAIAVVGALAMAAPACGSKKAEDSKAETKKKPGLDLKSRTEKAGAGMTDDEKKSLEKARKDVLGQ